MEIMIIGKHGDPARCEDVLLIESHIVAVIDGATDKSGRDFDGQSGGRLIARTVASALQAMPAAASLPQAMDTINEAIAQALQPYGELSASDRPAACMVAYSPARQEIWRVGDQHYAINGKEHVGTKLIDQINSSARSLYLHLLDEAGQADSETDRGRELIMPILRMQGVFANHATSPYGFAAINGLDVPPHLLEVAQAPDWAQIVLASDGYTRPAPTLAEAEQLLAAAMDEDPRCIGVNASTKGINPGMSAYDDRTYVSFRAGDPIDQRLLAP